MRRHTMTTSALALIAFAATSGPAPANAQELLFWSTQARPVEEAQGMREQVLSGFEGGSVDYQPQDAGPFITRLRAETEANRGTIAVVGALHGELTAFADAFMDLSAVDVSAASPALVELGRLGTDEQRYVPWMQATYLMAANRAALEHLPEGADVNALGWDELIAWGRAMAEATGSPKIGLPAGPQGLRHRVVQGYFYPSFTDSMVTRFRSDDAVAMWETVKELWEVTSPRSTSYNFMQEPLLADEVWVAIDHTARLADAFNQRPDDFIAFPAPAGPTGRGFMPVVAGIAVPSTAPDPEAGMALVSYMLRPDTQIATLRATNFFPVVDVELPEDMPPSVRAAGAAIALQSGAPDANPGLLPVGLGDLGGQFNQVYIDTFERIVLAGQPIEQVLDDGAAELRRIVNEAGAPCWAPDAPSEGPCPVE
ncbi:ABC transporter substrate-binding protein [Salinarimonas chemoclinalis]|uniref:ABC transporter substrate-binding protein n=1 Tax=Salinarimonas chemoclinalis TaxID=3241599 RepID=UPI003558A8BB